MGHPSLTFTLPPSTPTFGPRVGQVTLTRSDNGDAQGTVRITIDTPNTIVGTVRGVIPHLSRDHANGSDAIRWINVPFESFLEQAPPIPTLQNGPHPLHRFFGFDTDRHIASLCLRDPLDVREMPPNGNTHVSTNCIRGVKKVTLSDWRQYVYKTQPDVVFALTDTPFLPPPVSQKRITKSIERSATWVADILRPLPVSDAGGAELPTSTPRLSPRPLNVFVHMAGDTSKPARAAFAHALLETLHGPEAEAVKPLRCLDEGITGYTFDLAVLRGVRPRPNTSQHQTLPEGFLQWEAPDSVVPPEVVEVPTITSAKVTTSGVVSMAALDSRAPPLDIVSLLKTSLEQLSEQKPRITTGIRSPHEMLRLIRDVGVDLFDVGWAIHAANVGVALDFVFPAPTCDGAGARWHLGHNLYDPIYTHQFGRLADTLVGSSETTDGVAERPVCPCIACSPCAPSSHVSHSVVDGQPYATADEEERVRYEKPYSRAYLHHLLHTHEMSAHTLLVAHNLAVVSVFLADVRRVWRESENAGFGLEVKRFSNAYDENGEIFVAAKKDWECVDKARGKGRLTREREKQNGQVGNEQPETVDEE